MHQCWSNLQAVCCDSCVKKKKVWKSRISGQSGTVYEKLRLFLSINSCQVVFFPPIRDGQFSFNSHWIGQQTFVKMKRWILRCSEDLTCQTNAAWQIGSRVMWEQNCSLGNLKLELGKLSVMLFRQTRPCMLTTLTCKSLLLIIKT